MGSVFEAHDPQLDRKVAIKLLHAKADPDDAESKRLLREARALAQINHPNVVEVFGAGIDDGRVWLAMELVEGQTLKTWAASNPPGTVAQRDEALALLRQAAEGLAAAHAVSMTHRDFKPSNVLIGEDSRVRVVDFGLAVRGEVGNVDADVERSVTDDPSPRLLDDLITRTGKVVGTPRYMAPEQHLGEPSSPRTDQFAFAVTAWELLHGCPPFEANNLAVLYGAIVESRFSRHRETNVPRRVNRALRKGMSPSVSRRFRSLRGLMAALDGKRRRRWVAAAVVGGGAVGLLAFWPNAAPENTGDTSERCVQQARDRVEQVWTAAQRASIDRALTDSGVPYAIDAKRSLERAVARWRREWVSSAAAHCKAEGIVAPCLERDLVVLEGVLATMTDLSASQAERITRPLDALPRPSRCVSGAVGAPTDVSFRDRLTAAEIAIATGDDEGALAIAEALLDGERELPWDAKIDALCVLGAALSRQDNPRCTEVYAEAYELAVAHDAANLATEMAWKATSMHAKHDDLEAAEFWAKRQRAQAARGDHGHDFPPDELRCLLLNERKEYEGATQACEAALAAVDAGEASRLRRPAILRRLGALYPHAGKPELGLKISEEALAETVRELGLDHPRTGGMLLNLGVAYGAAGKPRVAAERAGRAREIFQRAYGAGNRWVVSATMNEAADWELAGDLDRASELLESLLPALHLSSALQRARVLNNLALVRVQQRRFLDALELIAKVEVIEAAELRPDDPQTAFTRMTRAWAYSGLERWDAALDETNAAIEIRERTGEFQQLSGSLHCRAFVYRRLGRFDLALADINRTLEFVEEGTFAKRLTLPALLDGAAVTLDQGHWSEAEGFLKRSNEEFQMGHADVAAETAVYALLRARLALGRGGDGVEILRDAEDAYDRMTKDPFNGYPVEEAKTWIDGLRKAQSPAPPQPRRAESP